MRIKEKPVDKPSKCLISLFKLVDRLFCPRAASLEEREDWSARQRLICQADQHRQFRDCSHPRLTCEVKTWAILIISGYQAYKLTLALAFRHTNSLAQGLWLKNLKLPPILSSSATFSSDFEIFGESYLNDIFIP